MIRYNPRGLSPNEVAESRRQHGDNVITPPKDDSVWKLLADKFRDPIIRILLLAAVLSLAIGFVHKDFTESIGIICAIILATCVGFWFERRVSWRLSGVCSSLWTVACSVTRPASVASPTAVETITP